MDEFELSRPDPEKLLKKIIKTENEINKGKLKIFFGMCAGVGKTYSMLQAAQKSKLAGIDIVIGIVETHGRFETEELIDGLEIIPRKEVSYRNSVFKEMDIDAILNRKPELVLVDELAHTNIPGSRHIKRYQDVLEIISNGIDVYTTLNVQHIESRSEIVKKITGSTMRETVPDTILDESFEIELVDITPDELLQRLAEGKIYTEETSKHAIDNFFRKGNLTALREMSLRITAERVDKDLKDYKTENNISDIWKSGLRLMCAISPSPYSAELIRWTKRLSYSLEAPWIAVYVETNKKISESNKEILTNNFKLVKELGGELILTQDSNIIQALVRVAKENNISQIVVGKSRKSKLTKSISYNNFTQELIKASGDLDVYIVGGDKKESNNIIKEFQLRNNSDPIKYLYIALIIGMYTLILHIFKNEIGYEIVSMFYLLLISLFPILSFGVGPNLFAAFLSALSWNYFFIPPFFTFHIEKPDDVFMFILFFIVALVSGYLSSKLRTNESLLRYKEKRTSFLFNLSKRLSAALNIDDIAEIVVDELKEKFSAEIIIIFAESENKLNAKPHSASTIVINDVEWSIAQWAFSSNQITGKFTNTLPSSEFTYYPISTKSGTLGVIGIKFNKEYSIPFDKQELLNDTLNQISKTIEREYLDKLAKKSMVASQSEKLYKTLFNSLSHELKTPITTIIGAVSLLSEKKIMKNENHIENVVEEINFAADRLNRLVENLLDMARIESGHIKIKLQWNSITDLIASVLTHLKKESQYHKIYNKILEDCVFQFDFALLEQALKNIIHNSLIYTPKGSEITIKGLRKNDNYIIIVSDNGSGFANESLQNLFNKFYRAPGTKTGGTGLGLSIAKGFVEAHGGTISASNKISGGAEFSIILPMDKKRELNVD